MNVRAQTIVNRLPRDVVVVVVVVVVVLRFHVMYHEAPHGEISRFEVYPMSHLAATSHVISK